MQQRMMALESAYEKLRQALNKITGEPSQDLINETVECCLRPIEGVKNRYLVGRMYSNQRDCQVLSEASRRSQKQVYREGSIVMIQTVKCCLRPIEGVKN